MKLGAIALFLIKKLIATENQEEVEWIKMHRHYLQRSLSIREDQEKYSGTLKINGATIKSINNGIEKIKKLKTSIRNISFADFNYSGYLLIVLKNLRGIDKNFGIKFENICIKPIHIFSIANILSELKIDILEILNSDIASENKSVSIFDSLKNNEIIKKLKVSNTNLEINDIKPIDSILQDPRVPLTELKLKNAGMKDVEIVDELFNGIKNSLSLKKLKIFEKEFNIRIENHIFSILKSLEIFNITEISYQFIVNNMKETIGYYYTDANKKFPVLIIFHNNLKVKDYIEILNAIANINNSNIKELVFYNDQEDLLVNIAEEERTELNKAFQRIAIKEILVPEDWLTGDQRMKMKHLRKMRGINNCFNMTFIKYYCHKNTPLFKANN